MFVVEAKCVHYLVQSSKQMSSLYYQTLKKKSYLSLLLPAGRTEAGAGGGTRLLQRDLHTYKCYKSPAMLNVNLR